MNSQARIKLSRPLYFKKIDKKIDKIDKKIVKIENKKRKIIK